MSSPFHASASAEVETSPISRSVERYQPNTKDAESTSAPARITALNGRRHTCTENAAPRARIGPSIVPRL